jgi:hypothetical protein
MTVGDVRHNYDDWKLWSAGQRQGSTFWSLLSNKSNNNLQDFHYFTFLRVLKILTKIKHPIERHEFASFFVTGRYRASVRPKIIINCRAFRIKSGLLTHCDGKNSQHIL